MESVQVQVHIFAFRSEGILSSMCYDVQQMHHYAKINSSSALHPKPVRRAAGDESPVMKILFSKSVLFLFQMVIPGDVAEMTEFQEKTMNNSRFILELCFPNVQLVLPSKAFYEKLHNRYAIYNSNTFIKTVVIKKIHKALGP